MQTLPAPADVDGWLARPGTAWLFKHSRTCPVSAAARVEVEDYFAAHPGDALGLVVVQDHRPASNRAAERLGIRHESPQIFLLRDGRLLWNASHGEITREAMERAAAGV
jgi:bacillithiol system protein YtxJ